MTALIQENRQSQIGISLGNGNSAEMLLQHFSGIEALSRDYTYSATVLTSDSSIDGNAAIGEEVNIAYHNEDGRTRKFHGFVSRFEYNEQVEEPVQMTSYTMDIVPWLWFLKHNQDFRIFQEMTTPDILKEIFQNYQCSDFRMQLTESYPTREYCVQYNESDFDFVSRLLEEEGIYYYFEHSQDRHVLVLCDSTAGYFDLDEPAVVYGPVGVDQQEQLTSWKHIYEFRPSKVAQKDFNFKKPNDGLVTDKKGKVKFKRSDCVEIFEYPGRYDAADKGNRLTNVRMEELEAEHDRVLGRGSYLSFTPGGKFKIDKHSRREEEGKTYVITEVFTEFNSNIGFDGGDTEDFRNEFRCIPAQTPFRPARATKKPFVEGPQTAIVVTDGQEIVVDDHARVKVQFHWDRYGKQDVDSSCWIRVSQTHAGKGWGVVDIPRKDEEVIVSFLDGDPDRPIITGRVYNGENQVPFGLKGAGDNNKNKTRRGNTTKSYGGGGYNEMTMDDTDGQEQIRIHGQNNMDTTVQNDQTLTVNNNRTKTIANDETNSIGNNRSTEVAVDHTEKVGSDQKVTVGSKQSVTVGTMKNETVGMMSNEMVGIAKTLNVGAVYSVVTGAMNTAVGYKMAEEIGFSKTVLVGSDYSLKVGSDHSVKVGKNYSLNVSDAVAVEAGDVVEIKCGASKLRLESGGKVTIEGTEFLFSAAGSVKINGSIIDLN
jgi:type VI secretion system secreted protein VgrG